MIKQTTTEHIPHLIYKHLMGIISHEEREELNLWIDEAADNKALFHRLTNTETLAKEYRMRKAVDTERPMSDMLARIEREFNNHQTQPSAALRHIRRWLSAAAIVIFVAGAVFYAYRQGMHTATLRQQAELAQAETITHGETRAMLTLANGETIELGADTGKNEKALAEHSAHPTTDSQSSPHETRHTDAPGQTLHLQTPRGGEFKVTLEDGTEVWLNAESQLRYPETFGGSERRVVVSGEAYFKVAKDAERPFYVESAGQLVQVYGTEFNINSYQEDANVYTTLVSGSIALRPMSTGGGELVLSPGHQAVFDKGDASSHVRTVDTSVVTSWRKGKFVFENQTLDQIMLTLSRWYDFDYEFRDSKLRNTIFMGSVPRYGQFSEVLNILEKSGGLKFTQKGKTIIINTTNK